MPKTFTAIYDGKVLCPEESLNLEPDTQYIVTIKRKKKTDKETLWDFLDKITGTVEGPEDWSEQLDHYLYGVPKSERT